MIPKLIEFGPFTVYSYGLMLGIAFIVASYVLSKELERRKMDKNLATEITLISIIFGIAGSKLFSILENFNDFLANPFGEIFSPGGLTYYGGFILVTLVLFVYFRKKKIPFPVIADATAPCLALAYGIGRIGCHLSGDGDYGYPTSLPWGVNYENGTVPPSFAFSGSEIARSFPNGIVPDNTPLHPTPLYEFIVAVGIFYILYRMNKKNLPDGKVFCFYLVMTGAARLCVEFLRLNPRYLLGLSQAQLISVGLMSLGLAGIYYFSKHKDLKKYVPPVIKPAVKTK